MTVSCSEGDTGFIYDGLLETEVSEVQRGVIAGIPEETKTALSEQMGRFKAGQKQDIVRNFERMTAETGAEVADPTQMRAVGKIVAAFGLAGSFCDRRAGA